MSKLISSISPNDTARISFLNLFLSLGIIGCFLAFIDSALVKHSLDKPTTFFLLGFGLVCIGALITTITTKKTLFARITIHLSIVAIVIYALLNTNYGIFWIFIGPVVIVLIEPAVIALALLVSNIALILAVQYQTFIQSNYSNQEVITASLSIALVSAGLMIYRRKYDSNTVLVIENEKRLEELTKKLQDEVVIKDKNQTELNEMLSKISQHNKQLLDSRLALTNVLEDQKILEEELKVTNDKIEQKVQLKTAQLSEEHARLKAIIESLPLGLIILDRELKQFSCNKIAEQLIRRNSVENTTVDACPMLFESLKIKKAVQDCLQHKSAVSLKDINYNDKVLRIHLAPITAHKTTVASGAVVVVDDITEERVMQRSKEEFLSIASHELRTPLTTIRGNASLLNKIYRDKISDPDFAELTDDIALSSERLISIVNDYLETSSLEQGKITVTPEYFSVETLSQKIIHEFAATAKDKGLYLRLIKVANQRLPQAYADPNRVSQILINLISNALNYTHSGGVEVKITTSDKNYLQIHVSDTGEGISPSNQKLLFHKFQSANEKILTRDSRRSTGLGLYIAKLLTEMMGGEIRLDSSKKNHGSCFVFTLPTVKPN